MKQKRKTGKKLLSYLLTLTMVVGLMPGMGMTAYAAGGGTEVTQANVICQQYSYMDAGSYSGGAIYDTPPADITNIALADAQAFGAAVNCPTTYWVVVYAKDGDNLKWTSNGKTGEQTSTPRSASGRVLSAWCELYNGDVFSLNGNPMSDVTFYFSKGLATVGVTGVSLDKTTAQTIDVDGTVSFTATVAPYNATDKKVKWSVGGTKADAVKLYTDEACTTEVGTDATDKLTVYAKGVSAGSATVTTTSNADSEKKASCDVTVNAAQTQTEEVLTTITATGKEQASYNPENVASVSFSYSSGGSSSYTNNGKTNWGWWGYGWSATVNAAEGYTITKCVFYDDKDRTATDSEAPFVVETTEEDKTPQVNGTPILANQSKGITKIEVYGYATPTATHSVIYNTNGGSAVDSATGVTALPDPLPTPTKDGYTFEGWYTDEGLTTAAVAGAEITADTTLYAKWVESLVGKTYPVDGTGNLVIEGVTRFADGQGGTVIVGSGTYAISFDNLTDNSCLYRLSGNKIYITNDTTKRINALTIVEGTGLPGDPYVFAFLYDNPISYTVTFSVANGLWDDGTTADKTVILTGYEGDTLKLASDQIPAVGSKANATYKAGNWDVAPNTTTAITAAATYTYTYAQKISITPTVSIEGWAYGEAAKTPSVNGNTGDGTVTYTYAKKNTTNFSTTVPSDAGEYTVKAEIAETDDYMAGETTADFTIEKALAPTVTVPTPEAVTYDPAKTLADISLADGWRWVTGTTVPTVGNAGYDAELTVDDANYNYTGVDGYSAETHKVTRTVALTVNKATVTVPAIASKTYNGKKQTADVEESTLYTVTTNAGGTNVGTYDVVLTLADSNNYKWTDSTEATKILTFQITKASAPTVSVPTPEAVTYDPAKTLADISLADGWRWVTGTTVPTVGNAGYDAELTVDDANYNYTGVDGYSAETHKVTRTVALTVNKATVTVPAIAFKTYNGKKQTADVEESTLYTVTTNAGGMNVGTYDVVLTLADSNNYKWTDSTEATKILTFQITKALAPTVTVPTPEAVTYDSAKTLADISLADGWRWVTGTTVPTVGNAGYDAELTVDDTNNDYSEVEGYDSENHKVVRTVTLTVNKADSNAATVTPVNRTYDGMESSLATVTGDAVGGVMNYALGENGTTAPTEGWRTSIPTATDVGTYYVWYKVVGDENHTDTDPEVLKVTIDNADQGETEIKTEVKKDDKSPEVKPSNLTDEFAESTLSNEEKTVIEEAINNGEDVKVDVYLEIKDISNTISASDQEKVKAAAADADKIEFFDISLFKELSISGQSRGATSIHNLTTPLKLTIGVPKSFPAVADGYTRTYAVLRLHGGSVTVLPSTLNADGTLSFETDKFSTYALVYTDTKAAASTSDATTATAAEAAKTSPKTDDSMPIAVLVLLMLTSAGMLVFMDLKKKKN